VAQVDGFASSLFRRLETSEMKMMESLERGPSLPSEGAERLRNAIHSERDAFGSAAGGHP
jgi:hypothetical protein